MGSEIMLIFCQLYLVLSTNLIFTTQEEGSTVLQNQNVRRADIIFKDQCLNWERSYNSISKYLLSPILPSLHTVIDLSGLFFNRYQEIHDNNIRSSISSNSNRQEKYRKSLLFLQRYHLQEKGAN